MMMCGTGKKIQKSCIKNRKKKQRIIQEEWHTGRPYRRESMKGVSQTNKIIRIITKIV